MSISRPLLDGFFFENSLGRWGQLSGEDRICLRWTQYDLFTCFAEDEAARLVRLHDEGNAPLPGTSPTRRFRTSEGSRNAPRGGGGDGWQDGRGSGWRCRRLDGREHVATPASAAAPGRTSGEEPSPRVRAIFPVVDGRNTPCGADRPRPPRPTIPGVELVQAEVLRTLTYHHGGRLALILADPTPSALSPRRAARKAGRTGRLAAVASRGSRDSRGIRLVPDTRGPRPARDRPATAGGRVGGAGRRFPHWHLSSFGDEVMRSLPTPHRSQRCPRPGSQIGSTGRPEALARR